MKLESSNPNESPDSNSFSSFNTNNQQAKHHDHVHNRRTQPRRRRQANQRQGDFVERLHVALATSPPVGRGRSRVLRQHLQRSVPLSVRVPGQHLAPGDNTTDGQVSWWTRPLNPRLIASGPITAGGVRATEISSGPRAPKVLL